MHTIELLAPAKDIECAKAAIDSGADAIYIGMVDFSLRAMRKGELITLDNLKSCVDLAHSYGKQVYLTLNIFAYDEFMKYDLELMNKDIEKYGLYTYEDFKDLVSIEVYNAFPFKYYKVAISKGEFLYSDLVRLIEFYNSVDSVK
jgi:collagenase-like PrtC family protease